MLSPAERPVLARALSPIPQNRFPTCLDLMAALLTALDLRIERNDEGAVKVRRNSGDSSESRSPGSTSSHSNGN